MAAQGTGDRPGDWGVGTAADSPPADSPTLEAEVLESQVVDEGLLWRLLRRGGRAVALPALECLELLLDAHTPVQVRMTMLAALTYLLLPLDLVPDLIPVAGFSDDLVALTALLAACSAHRTEAVQRRARRRLDRWFPPGR